MNDTKTQNVCKHAEPASTGEPPHGITDLYEEGDENPNNVHFTYPAPPSEPSAPPRGFDPHPDLDWPLDAIRKNQSVQTVPGDAPKTNIEKKYLIALRWFKLFYNFFQEDIKGKPSAAMSAMSEDSELQELLREADRIR